MTSSNEHSPTDVDREALHGEWLRNTRWRDSLARRAAHKALNIPEDDMHIEANRTVNHYHAPQSTGLGKLGAGLIGAALAAGTGGMGFGIWQALQPAAKPATQAIEKVLTRDADVSAGTAIVEPPRN